MNDLFRLELTAKELNTVWSVLSVYGDDANHKDAAVAKTVSNKAALLTRYAVARSLRDKAKREFEKLCKRGESGANRYTVQVAQNGPPAQGEIHQQGGDDE